VVEVLRLVQHPKYRACAHPKKFTHMMKAASEAGRHSPHRGIASDLQAEAVALKEVLQRNASKRIKRKSSVTGELNNDSDADLVDGGGHSGARSDVHFAVGGDVGLKAGLGDIITASVKGSHAGKPGKTGHRSEGGDCAHAQRARRRDGTYIRFDDNAAVLINDGATVGDARFGRGSRTARKEICQDCFLLRSLVSKCTHTRTRERSTIGIRKATRCG